MSKDESRTHAVQLGDEREQAIANEAAGVGLAAGIYTGLGIAVVTAVAGSLLLPVVLLILAAVPSWTMMWWARRRHVDLGELSTRAPARYQMKVLAASALSLLLVLAAMAWTLFTGHGLVELPVIDVGPDAAGPLRSLARGAVLGGMGGVLIAIVAGIISARRRR